MAQEKEMSLGLRLLICGGRHYGDRRHAFFVLDNLREERGQIALVIQGGYNGADALADIWATERGIHCAEVKALWKTHDKAAGPIRNQAMIDLLKPDLVVAFPGHLGTEDMVKRAMAAGVEVVRG